MGDGQDSEILTERDILLAIFGLLLEEREERVGEAHDARRAELPLHEVGLAHKQIAALVNNTPEAVRKAISRGL